ncbi:MAG: DUF177 domain-containing protein [Desulfobacteraceae bacterium]|nr:DUF177 domain-containing protein [Desulfobacteraceae bacterium]
MKLEINHLSTKGTQLFRDLDANEFPGLKQLSEQGECEFISPVHFSLKVFLEKELIQIQGLFSCRIKLTCSRCLELFESQLKRNFRLRFSNRIPADVHPGKNESGENEIELTAEQIGLGFYEGEVIDLAAPLQEQVIIALPFKALCNESCKGLCSQCGVDLNSTQCECEGNRSSTPFNVLKKLNLPKK